ncbi:hypothetical protein NQ317_016408 [Molorchus minor]|uniref:Uncharacterized protein n=1 Tax=Molorchus minor TaxID=1323400 RepID=A0ABQ9J868_9CUCU|nr:hypothetical protein NQ317_016408 [Molorchus minor]
MFILVMLRYRSCSAMGCEDKFCDETQFNLATENVGVNIVQMLGINKWAVILGQYINDINMTLNILKVKMDL